MSDRTRLMLKADRYLTSAEVLAGCGDFDSAVSRAYYAAFYVAEALLDALGQSFSSHRSVISAYGLEFAKTGRLDARFHRMLIGAFEKRQQADYLPDSGLEADDAASLIRDVKQFHCAARVWLEKDQAP